MIRVHLVRPARLAHQVPQVRRRQVPRVKVMLQIMHEPIKVQPQTQKQQRR